MRSTVLLLLILGFGAMLSAQPIDKASYETMIATAEESVQNKDYYNALDWYEKAYEEKKDRGLTVTIAELHYFLRDYIKAERWYARLFRRDKENKFAPYRYTYGRILKMNGKYREAKEELQTFILETKNDSLKTLAKAEMTGADLALEYGGQDLTQNSEGVAIDNLGKRVNTPFSEYSPVVGASPDELYYVGFDTKEVIVVDEKNNDYHSRIYKSGKEEENWGRAKALDKSINRPGVHTTSVAFSKDGNTMFFTRASLGGNELAESKMFYVPIGAKEAGAVKEIQGINGDYVVKHPAAGELFGSEVMFFAANISGGYGGYDIYYATKKEEGIYGDPVNLGAMINTKGDEETPFYRDGILYFSSTGHPGFGGFDNFYATWDGTKWGEPSNMGKGFNSGVDDQYLSIDEEGYVGFFTSNRPGDGVRSAHGKTCCNDIYGFEIAKLFAALVVGVFSEDKKPIIGAETGLVEIVGGQPGDINAKVGEKGNRFDFPLDLEKAYRIVVSKEGYFPDSVEINTVGLEESKTFEQRFFLKPKPKEPEFDTLVINEAIVLENILYDFDDDRIKEESETDLKVVMDLMNQYPEMKIELSSHTDSRGNDDYNEDLSQRRAESARRWLVRNGIGRDRIVAKGYGEKDPQRVSANAAGLYDYLSEGDTLTDAVIMALEAEEQQEVAHGLNRRTTFTIIEGPTTITIKRITKKEETKPAPKGKKSYIPVDTARIHELSSLHGRKDFAGVPIMAFDKRVVDFGKVKKGEERNHTYRFVNQGDTDLLIAIVSTCDCTTADYSEGPYKPGESGVIEVTFDSTEKDYPETIDIDIILDNLEPDTGDPIIERIQYQFDIEK